MNTPVPQTALRRRLTFSLRSLLLLVLTLGSAMAVWFQWEPWRPAFLQHTGVIKAAALSPDGRYVAAYTPQNGVMIWALDTGEQHHALKKSGPPESDYRLNWAPDSSLVCAQVSHSRHDDSKCSPLVLLRPNDGQCIQKLIEPHSHWRPVFSRTGQRMFTGTRMWHARSGALVVDVGSIAYSIAFSPDEHRFACYRNNVIEMWDADLGVLLWEEPVWADTWIRSLKFSSDSQRLFSLEDRRPIPFDDGNEIFEALEVQLGFGDTARYSFEYRREWNVLNGAVANEVLLSEGVKTDSWGSPEIWSRTYTRDKQRKIEERHKQLVIADGCTNQQLATVRGATRTDYGSFQFSEDGERLLGIPYDTTKTLVLWTRVHSEYWFGLFAVPQFWLTLVLAGGLVASLWQDLRWSNYKHRCPESRLQLQVIPTHAL